MILGLRIGKLAITGITPQFCRGLSFLKTINLENGKQFKIITDNFSDQNIYISKIYLNNKLLDRNYLTHSEIISGGTLKFVMSPNPDKTRGINESTFPYLLDVALVQFPSTILQFFIVVLNLVVLMPYVFVPPSVL